MAARRSVLCLGVVVAAVMLGAVSYAFACSAQAVLAPLSPGEGARGTEVRINATTWAADPAGNPALNPVRVRWGGETGPEVATAVAGDDGKWTTTFKVPDAPPGTYLVVASAYDGNGNVVLTGSEAFTVTGPASAPTQPAGSGTSPSTAVSSTASTTGSPAATPAAEQSSVAPAATTSPADEVPSSRPATQASAATASSPASAAVPAMAAAATATQASPPVRASGAPPATTEAAAPTGAAPLAPAGSTDPAVATPLPDPATVWADTGTAGKARPSLVSDAPASRGSAGLAATLFVIGTLGLFATGLVVAASRRRVAAPSSTR